MATNDSNISDDYRPVIEEYGEEDYLIVSKEEIDCHTDRLIWEEAKARGLTSRSCPPFWDKILCWPSLGVGVASKPCPDNIRGIDYDTSKSAHLECLGSTDPGDLSWPVWANKSDYTACTPILPPSDLPELLEDQNSETLSHIYFIGYSLSLVALIVATTIFLYFKEMRCLRNKIHSNLFLTFILADTCWITTAVMQTIQAVQTLSDSSLEFSWCVSLIFSRYFHLATFFWMFVEVIATFSVEDSRMKFRHYFLLGWGFPLVVVCLWAVFTQSKVLEERQKMLQSPNYTQALHHCPFMETTSHEWIYIGPVLLVLATNAFFLVSIFYVVVAKLRSTGQRESSDHQNWRAAKALLVIIPLLGITYLITILPPISHQSVAYPVFAHFRAILLSTQGFMVTLPYCFLNTEVKGILQHHWKRWRNTRNVEYNYSRGHSARNSISLAGYYACDSTVLTASRRNSFFRLHSQYLSGSGCHTARTGESGLVTSVMLDRDHNTGRTTNRIIPVIQEEARTPSPSPAPAFLNTVISITPATPSHSSVNLTSTEQPSVFLQEQERRSCSSALASPCNRSLPESDTEHANSLIELDIPSEGLNNKSLSSSTLPQGSKIMPDILNFPPPKPGTFSASCPTVSDHHKEKR